MTAGARIISLVPSITELVAWLGVGERLVGRTRFCVEPRGAIERIPVIGGTKDPDISAIVAARPALVIANREENRREDVEALQSAGLEVMVTDPNTVSDAVTMIREVAARIGEAGAGEKLALDIEREMARPVEGDVRVFVPIWRRPLMGMGSATYGHDVVQVAGAVNVLAGRERYPEVTLDEVAALQPDVILLPDEPFRFQERHVPEFAAVAPAYCIDGKLLWWYGPRIPESLRELRRILREVQPAGRSSDGSRR